MYIYKMINDCPSVGYSSKVEDPLFYLESLE